MRDAQARQGFVGPRKVFRIGMMVRKNPRAAEKTGEHHIPSGGIRGARSQQVGRYNSEQRAQFENIPSLMSQDKDGRPFPREWIALPGNGLNQRGLAASVGRSEEHTSELQSHSDLVCRLLL